MRDAERARARRERELEAENASLRAALAQMGIDADHVAERAVDATATAREEMCQVRDGPAGTAAGHARELKEGYAELAEMEALNEALSRANTALGESEERWRALVSASSEVLYSMSPDWTEMRQLAGGGFLSDTGSPNRAWLEEYIHPDDQPRVAAAIREAVRTKGIFELEHRVRRADGALGWTHSRAVPLLDRAGGIREWFGAASDVTARKEAEAALRRLNETLEARVAERTAERDRVWRLSTDLMVVARFDARIVAVNPAWTARLGWREDELVGRSFMELVHPEDMAATAVETARQAQGLTTRRFENRYRRREGDYCWLSWTAVPDAGLIHAVARDVTAEKAATEALARAEEVLRQAQKMEAVGQLTGGVAHDFNNMLQAIGGALELAQGRIEQGRVAEVAHFVEVARGTVDRAAALTHRLLAFARRQVLQPKSLEPDELVQGMAELIRRTLGPGAALDLRLNDGVWSVLCDPSQLESALLNLAINARDSMPDGGRLTIRTADVCLSAADIAGQEGALPGEYVEIAVTDTGSGMDEATRTRAFEPFFTTKPIGQGAGLGLSQFYGFARQSGGFVRLDSAPGRGTTARLYLPRHAQAGERAGSGRQPGTAVDEPDAAGKGETVLLVEDEPGVRAVTAEHLRELGYEVLEAADGPGALRVLQGSRGSRVDVLVIDVGLPGGLNGRQVAEVARERRPGLPVLFITGYASNVLEGELAPGMAAMGGPFTLDALATKVRAMIEGGKGTWTPTDEG